MCGMISLNQSQFFATHLNRSVCFILYMMRNCYFRICQRRQRLSSYIERFGKKLFEKFVSLFYKTNRFQVALPLVCSCQILKSSAIYHWADPRQHGFYLINRFHFVVRLFSNKSQMTSKCGMNKKVVYKAIAFSFVLLFLVPVQWLDENFMYFMFAPSPVISIGWDG